VLTVRSHKWRSAPGVDQMSPVPMAIAHRGDPVARRENTIAAFESAVRAGADMVELDLRRTKDGEIVVVHDASLTRLWGVDRAVAEMDLAEVRLIGETGLGIPALREVVEHLSIPLMVDFTGEEVVEGAVRAVREARAMDRSMFVTGNVPALRVLRSIAPEARIGVTWNDPEPPPLRLLDQLGAEWWNPAFHLVTAERVALLHSLGRRVSTWTVDDPTDMARMLTAGVDAIVTNRIRDLRHVLAAGDDAPIDASGPWRFSGGGDGT
jgi:glycerophosphoryl diester phosphodiesterase